MSSIRHLVDIERWPIAHEPGSWKSPDTLSAPRSERTTWTGGRRRALKETVEAEVIPRLLLAHQSFSDKMPRSPPSTRRQEESFAASEVTDLVRLVIGERTSEGLAQIARLRSRGISMETVFHDLLAPSARLLGEMWCDDTVDFLTVTIATNQLKQIMRELAPELQGRRRARVGAAALLTSVPGNQHSFGISMLQEFFRRDGWTVSSDIPNTAQELININRSAPFRVIGLSAACDSPPDELAALIRTLRRSALDTRCTIIVGGRLFIEHPELVKLVGADATAADGHAAVRQLSSLLDTKPVRS